MEARNARTASHIFSALFQRPVGGKDVVLFKTLMIVHKILRDGPENAIDELYQRREFLESLKTQYDSVGTLMGVVDHAYAVFLVEKLKFNHAHPDVSGNLQKWKDTNKVKDLTNLVVGALELQKNVLFAQQKILQSAGLNECRLAGLIPLIEESYGAYTMCETLIRKLVDLDAEPNALVEQFLAQYPIIQKFYFACTTIPYITSRITVPSLSPDPPSFTKQKKKKKEKEREKEGTKEDLIDTAIANPAPTLGLFDPFAIPMISQNPNMFNSTPNNPFGGLLLPQQPTLSMPPQPQPQPQPTYQQQQPLDPFASLSALSLSLSQPQPTSSNPFGSSNPFAVSPNPVPTSAPFSQLGTPAFNQPFAQQPYESREALEKRIRELESQIKEVEVKIEDVTGKNNEIKRLLQDRTSALTEVEKQMRQRIQHQQSLFEQANKELQSRLSRMVAKYEQEKLLLLNEQVDFAKSSVEQQLAKFNDPSWAGNKGSTADNIQQSLRTLANQYNELLNTLETSADSVSACRALSDGTAQLLDDAKGAISRVSNPATQQQIASAAQASTSDVLRMFTHTKAIGQQGTKPDKGQMDFLRTEYTQFVQNLGQINTAIQSCSGELNTTTSAVELESSAERELSKASNYIHDATTRLTKHQEVQKQRALASGKAPGELDVESTLLGGLTAITNATKALVDAAAQTQQERVRKASTGVGYHRDPAWTEGLVLAASNVIKATEQLVIVGENIANGRLDDQALIAASRALSAATTQLITACRAKSDASSHASQLLDNAAAAVTRATKALVEAAKSLKSPEQMAILQKSELNAQQVIGEIEQQTRIIRLENELAVAQKVLHNMKRSKATNEHAGTSAQPFPEVPNVQSTPPFQIPTFSVTDASVPPANSNNPFM